MNPLKEYAGQSYHNNKGSMLIALIAAITIIGIMSAGTLYLTSGSTQTGLFANANSRAYYLAESGINYAKLKVEAGTTYTAATQFTLDSGDAFVIRTEVDPADSSRTLIYATGIVNPGSWFESKYDLTSNFLKSGGGGETDLGLTAEDDDGDLEIDPRWTITGGDAELTDHGDGGGHGYGYGYGHGGGDGDEDGDIELETETNRVRVGRSWVTVYDAILLSLGWWKTNPDNPDLAQAWSSNSELLSYEVQVKVKIETMGSHGNYFMHGISFRLSPQNPDWDDDTIQSYGISYFKAANSSWPFNVDLGSSFNSIMNNSVYIVLWEKLSSNDTLTLLDYRRLTTSDDVIDGSGNLEDWSTILLKLEEKFDGPGGARQNHISGFVQGEDTIPLGTIDWDYDHYNSVQWHTHDPQPVTDSSLTTAGFSTSKPDEIGLHAFYDSVSSNKQYFADFSLKLGGAGGASSSFQW